MADAELFHSPSSQQPALGYRSRTNVQTTVICPEHSSGNGSEELLIILQPSPSALPISAAPFRDFRHTPLPFPPLHPAISAALSRYFAAVACQCRRVFSQFQLHPLEISADADAVSSCWDADQGSQTGCWHLNQKDDLPC
jgi:hypothetical protein